MSATDFKQLWQSQQPAPVDPAEIIARAAKVRRGLRRKILLGNIALSFTLAFILFILLYYKPQMATTKIGILLMVVGLVMQIVAAGKLIPLSGENANASPAEYLSQMLQIQKKQAYLQTTIMSLYFILLGAGLVLYLYEYTLRMGATGMATAYGLTALWFAVSWFYLRPKAIRKQNAQFQQAIENLENINRQFAEEQ